MAMVPKASGSSQRAGHVGRSKKVASCTSPAIVVAIACSRVRYASVVT